MRATIPLDGVRHKNTEDQVSKVIESIYGTCTDVVDGDTFVVRDFLGKETRIRLARVNAPEVNTPGAALATQRLSRLVLGQNIRCDVVAYSYGRSVAEVYVGSTHINELMRSHGYR